jgi:simple sugar transport system permease protein/ribose transport system permease protein
LEQRGRWWTSQPVIIAAITVALLVAGRLSTPEFVTVSNMLTILRAASITGIVALGMTFVTISGNYFSLSVSQTAVLASIIYAALGASGGLVVALGAALLACMAIGMLQGGIIGAGGNPVVVTVAAGAVIAGGALVATNSKRVLLHAPPDSLAVQIGQATPLGIPSATWAFVLAAAVCTFLLSRTSLGRRTYLVGANRRTAVASGLPVRTTIMVAFTVASVGACLAGVLNAAEFGVADTAQFTGLDINAIAAVLIGGTAIKGGEGSVARTAMGTLFIAVLQNLLQLRGYDYGVRLTVVGLVVAIAVSVYALVRKKREG